MGDAREAGHLPRPRPRPGHVLKFLGLGALPGAVGGAARFCRAPAAPGPRRLLLCALSRSLSLFPSPRTPAEPLRGA